MIHSLCHLVELQGKAALLACSVILMNNTSADGLVDGLDSGLVSAIGLLLIAFCNGSFELLEGRLQNGLGDLVALVVDLGNQNSLLRRLNVGHDYTSSDSVLAELLCSMQKHIITARSQEINPFFLFFQKNSHKFGKRQTQ